MACRLRKRYLSRRRADDKSLDTHDSMKTTWKTTARHKSYAVTANTQRCRETPDRNSETVFETAPLATTHRPCLETLTVRITGTGYRAYLWWMAAVDWPRYKTAARG